MLLRYHRGPSNNALLEVIVQLRLQYQELLDRLASQPRVKETVKIHACHTPATNSDASTVHLVADSVRVTEKAQARHTPATFSDISTMHPAADPAWKNMKAESVPVRATSDKSDHSGRTVGSHCRFFPEIPFGRCEYLSCHAK